jgi:hypothetical protein
MGGAKPLLVARGLLPNKVEKDGLGGFASGGIERGDTQRVMELEEIVAAGWDGGQIANCGSRYL